jgi:hypothetical protein
MRVYAVNSACTITQDRGTVTVTGGNQPMPVGLSTAFPLCSCLRCRTRQAVCQ